MTHTIHRLTAPFALAALGLALLSVSSGASANTETIFPKAAKILKPIVPEHCREWNSPAPVEKKDVDYPAEARGLTGEAALLVKIGANGEYLGVSDFLATDDLYAKAAENSVQNWTFRPARCNGDAIASEARVDFRFRREGGVTYPASSSAIKR
jgi:outer membrane biosynthesis protein TonB